MFVVAKHNNSCSGVWWTLLTAEDHACHQTSHSLFWGWWILISVEEYVRRFQLGTGTCIAMLSRNMDRSERCSHDCCFGCVSDFHNVCCALVLDFTASSRKVQNHRLADNSSQSISKDVFDIIHWRRISEALKKPVSWATHTTHQGEKDDFRKS